MRRLRPQNELALAFGRSALILSLLAALATAACDIGVSGGGGDDDDDAGDVTPPPPPPPPPPGAAIYKPGSLTPNFRLLPVQEQPRFNIPNFNIDGVNQGVAVTNAQFVNVAGGFPTLAQK